MNSYDAASMIAGYVLYRSVSDYEALRASSKFWRSACDDPLVVRADPIQAKMKGMMYIGEVEGWGDIDRLVCILQQATREVRWFWIEWGFAGSVVLQKKVEGVEKREFNRAVMRRLWLQQGDKKSVMIIVADGWWDLD
jgi:hypothetical protein